MATRTKTAGLLPTFISAASGTLRDHSCSFVSIRVITRRSFRTLSKPRWSSAFRLRKWDCRKPVHRPRLKPELQHRCGRFMAQGCCYDKTRCPPRPRHPFQHESQTNGTRMTTNQITEHSPLAFIRGHSCSFVSIRVQNESAAPQHSRRGAGVQPSGCGSHAAESQFIDPG